MSSWKSKEPQQSSLLFWCDHSLYDHNSQRFPSHPGRQDPDSSDWPLPPSLSSSLDTTTDSIVVASQPVLDFEQAAAYLPPTSTPLQDFSSSNSQSQQLLGLASAFTISWADPVSTVTIDQDWSHLTSSTIADYPELFFLRDSSESPQTLLSGPDSSQVPEDMSVLGLLGPLPQLMMAPNGESLKKIHK